MVVVAAVDDWPRGPHPAEARGEGLLGAYFVLGQVKHKAMATPLSCPQAAHLVQTVRPPVADALDGCRAGALVVVGGARGGAAQGGEAAKGILGAQLGVQGRKLQLLVQLHFQVPVAQDYEGVWGTRFAATMGSCVRCWGGMEHHLCGAAGP